MTKFLIDIGANVSVKLTSTNYRRSPLVQGGLEIPCLVTVTMSGTIINQLIMERYTQLVNEKYVERKEEQIIGSFLHMNDGNDVANITIDVASVGSKTKKKKRTNNENFGKNYYYSRHQKLFFNGKNSAGNREKAAKNQLSKNISLDKIVVVIDD